LNQKPAQPGIFLEQQMNIVGTVFTPKCRLVASKGIFVE
jgi:hypothetical protein